MDFLTTSDNLFCLVFFQYRSEATSCSVLKDWTATVQLVTFYLQSLNLLQNENLHKLAAGACVFS